MRKIKTIRSYTGLARFIAGCSEGPVAWLARSQVADVSSPYAYSPTKPVFAWGGRNVCWFEVRHKTFEVYEVPADMPRFKTDDEAATHHSFRENP